MMDWVAEYEGFTAGQREDFRRIVNKLLAQTYITKRKEDQRRDYYFIERHESMIRTYLGMSGWDLIGDKGLGVYQAVNRDGFNRLQLRLQESIILLLVRLCYEERRRELTLAENVVVRVREIQEKYAALQIRDRPIDKKGLRDAIALMKRFNLVDVLDRNPVDPDCRLVLFPSILLAVRVDDIRQVYEKLASYRSAGREAAEDDVAGDEAAEGDVAGDEAAEDDVARGDGADGPAPARAAGGDAAEGDAAEGRTTGRGGGAAEREVAEDDEDAAAEGRYAQTEPAESDTTGNGATDSRAAAEATRVGAEAEVAATGGA